MTPEEALQHEWIKEAWGSRRDRVSRALNKRSSAQSPDSLYLHPGHPHHQYGAAGQVDPFKAPTQLPGKGKCFFLLLSDGPNKPLSILYYKVKVAPDPFQVCRE